MPAMRGMFSRESDGLRQLRRFGVVGLANVLVDLSVYAALMSKASLAYLSKAIALVGYAPAEQELWQMQLVASKAAAFCAGTVFAFFANRGWTFADRQIHLWAIMPFFLLYLFSMGVNVSINYALANLLVGTSFGLAAAYCTSVLVSATINFIGMKTLFSATKKKTSYAET